MRLIEIENKIKDLIAVDINNPEVYNEIFRLSYLFLMRKRLLSNAEYAEEVAWIMAEDLYMKILSGGQIISWIGYINKYYHGAIRTWRKMCSGEVIDTTGNLDLEEAIIAMSVTDTVNYQNVLDNMYLESITSVIDYVLSNSRYIEYTKEYTFAKISVLISLLRGYFVEYNLDEDEINYTRLLYNKIKCSIIKGIKEDSENTIDSGLSLLQLYAFSTLELESE